MTVDFDTREGIMKEWDKWANYYRQGGGGSWPRDAFESLLDYLDEKINGKGNQICQVPDMR